MTIFSELTAEGWVLVIGAIFLGLGQFASIILNWVKANRGEAKQDETLKVVNQVHTIANGSMGVVLAELAAMSRRVAELTGERVDLAIASEAEKKRDSHMAVLASKGA